MTQDIKTERRWLRSVIAASAEPLPVFPWMRGERRKPAALTGKMDDAGISAAKDVTQIALFRTPGAIAAR